MRRAALLSACALALSAPSARADFLNTPGELARAWAQLAPRVPPGAGIVAVMAFADSLSVEWLDPAPPGGSLGLVLHEDTEGPKTGLRIEALEWRADDPAVPDLSFGAAALAPLAGFDAWAARARAAVKLGADAAVVLLTVGHPRDDLGGGDALAYDISLETGTRTGHVRMDPEGRVLWVQREDRAAVEAPQAATAGAEPEPPGPWRGDGGRDLVAGLAAFAAHLGPEARIWEVDARPGRITVTRPHPTQARTSAILTLTEEGFRDESTFPQMMQTEADLFPLSALAGLTPQSVEAARAAGLAGVALPGGQVARLRIWSGAPFWRHPAGQPFFDIRVEVPPGNQNGYGVVTLEGQLVEAFR